MHGNTITFEENRDLIECQVKQTCFEIFLQSSQAFVKGISEM